MSKLLAIKPKKAKARKPKILIFGKAGVGKTWTSLEFPNVYYIDTEGGANLNHYTDKLEKSDGAYLGIDQGSLDFDLIINQVKALATEEHPFKTLVIDSITKIFNNSILQESERLGDKDVFGASRKPAIQKSKRLISWLQRLDMNVVIIAHEKAEWKNDKQIGETFDAWDKTEYELDLCLQISKEAKERFWKVRKSRFNEFPIGSSGIWTFDNFSKTFGNNVIFEKAVKVELCNENQLKELNQLLKTVNLPENWLDKCLNKEGVDEVEDLSFDSASKMIDFIKNKYLKNEE